ncbi:serine/threonine-protein kinase [Ideonella sp. A 288]|uniref:serine/threonine-protein kinase n=1 Tax=Ideonella sp. A 288 TaxID=1962181 RepID=UPI000B4B5FAD|nr:serine/threonine-protein kinase [Ideonella sp. A 288]
MPTPVPEQLGKYQITEVLGEGAMGVVYKAFDPDIRRVVALKTIRRQLDDGSDFAESIAARFRNEAQAAGRLQHPGIVGVYDYGEDGRTAFIAMEFVAGSNLSHFLASQIRFTDEDILSVMTQLLDALEHAHGQGVWHRDIKPANLIMTRAGRLKIADFGIARIEAGGLTQANMMVGTPTYMAPEQFLGKPIDKRVDIYGAGVVLFQLLTGRQPFTGTPEALMYKVVHDPAPVPSEVEGGAARPRAYDAIVAKALAKDPAQRFASAEAFRAAVAMAIGKAAAATVSDATMTALAARRTGTDGDAAAPTAGSAGGAAGRSSAASAGGVPTHWDAAVLSQVEHTLARHVGPLAGVMVRRAARDCGDLTELYNRLAAQVSNPVARSAFLGQASQATALTTAGGGAGTRSAAAGAVDDALRERAERLLAQQVGPIARIVVKKAAAATGQRDLFVARLAEAITDTTQRQRFIDELQRLA